MNLDTRYNIYRKETDLNMDNSSFTLLRHNCVDNVFVDAGVHPSIASNLVNKKPPEITITEFSPPKDIEIYRNTNIVKTLIGRTSPNKIRIVLYQRNSEEIPSFYLERFSKLLTELVPPELGFTITLCNDDYSKIIL